MLDFIILLANRLYCHLVQTKLKYGALILYLFHDLQIKALEVAQHSFLYFKCKGFYPCRIFDHAIF